MKSLGSLVFSLSNTSSAALSLIRPRRPFYFRAVGTTNFATTTMPSYQRVAIHRNPKYTHNGTKSYVFAMSKCKPQHHESMTTYQRCFARWFRLHQTGTLFLRQTLSSAGQIRWARRWSHEDATCLKEAPQQAPAPRYGRPIIIVHLD